MDIEKFKEKYTHPDSNKNLNSVQRLFWYLFLFIPFSVFTIYACVVLFIYFTRDNESYNISNIGFAILMGLASICFSYFKLIENGGYKKLHKDLQRGGEFFLISALAFVVSSALKYSWTTLDHESWLQRGGVRFVFSYTFFVAEVFCVLGLARLVDVLYFRITNNNP